MSVLRQLIFISLSLFVVTGGVHAAAKKELDKTIFEQKLSSLGLQVISVTDSDIEGIVEVTTNGGLLYSSPDATNVIAGTLYQFDKNEGYIDIVAKRQAPINAEKIEALKDSMIEFKANEEQYVVSIFTDITCGYCVRLHNQMKEYNALGITVRYLAYPRQGAMGPTAEQMAAIWAADDKVAAMNEAIFNNNLPKPKTAKSLAKGKEIVAKHYQLGQELAISGTPAIFLPNGEHVGGYLPPAQLLERLK